MKDSRRDWRVVRVFISSTFRDMQAERDHLVRFVFPKLREDLLKHRIHFVDIDLRWGVTSDLDALDVCREVVDECRPRFLCMLGGRYGWVPPGKTRSITADEVHYGVLDQDMTNRGFAFFYFRDPAVTKTMLETTPGEFSESVGSAKQRALEELKYAIVSAGLKVFNYSAQWDCETHRLTGLKTFGDQVYEDIKSSINTEFGEQPPEKLNEFARENAAMEAFIAERTERFVLGSRWKVAKQLLKHAKASGSEDYICVVGEPGSGKSALLAKLSRSRSLNNQPSLLLISHFVGASTGSTDVRRTLRRLCHELIVCTGITAEIPDDPEKLRAAFLEILKQVCAKKRVVIILDALNQFDSMPQFAGLWWLPEELPDNARIILSTLPGTALDDLRRRRQLPREVTLQSLTQADGEAIIKDFLHRYRKSMTNAQRAALLTKTDAGKPLYLLAALEELRTFGTYEKTTDRIVQLPPETKALFTWILKRLEDDDGFRDASGQKIGRELVPRFASLMGASRHGLSQRELAELLAPGDPKAEPTIPDDAQGNVAALLQLLRPYLMHRGELLDFYHGQFRAAAQGSYLTMSADWAKSHKTLAEFFRKAVGPDGGQTWLAPRSEADGASGVQALEEIPFHSYQFALWSGDSTLLFMLADDAQFRHRQFEHFASPSPSIDLIGYALEIAALASNAVHLVHFTMLRIGVSTSLARSYLYRLPEVVREGKGQMARAVARLIPEPAQRRLGFLLVAWMLRGDSIQSPFISELIREALGIELQADIYQSALLLEIARGLCQEGFYQAAAFLDWVPPSPIREGYQRAWSGRDEVTRELADHFARTPAANLPVSQTELEEFRLIRQFIQRFSGGFKTWPNSRHSAASFETQLCEKFGPSGAAGAYFLMACDQILCGNDRPAEVLVTRGIYLCTSLPRPALRTLAATSQAFGARGEIDMSREQEARVRTFGKSAFRMARTPQEKARLEDERRELVIAIDGLANTWRPPGARDLFQLAVRDHVSHAEDQGSGQKDAFTLLANARLLLAQNRSEAPSDLLSEVVAGVPKVSPDQQPGLLLASYCLARICNDANVLRHSASALAQRGLEPESLFPAVSPRTRVPCLADNRETDAVLATVLSPKAAKAVAVVATADPRCISAVALSLRVSGQTRVLMELIWRLAHLGLSVSSLDPLLCELALLPNLSSSDLRRISDAVLFTGRHLTIPSGLGIYYYPGIMLVSGWTGGVLIALGLSTVFNWGALLPLAGAVLVAGAIGSFTDLWLWQRMRLWERPERSRRLVAELGTIAAFWAAVMLSKPHLPDAARQSGLFPVGILLGLAAEGLLLVGFGVRGLLFRIWRTKDVALGSALAFLLGFLACWVVRRFPGGEVIQHLMGGLFLAGTIMVSVALNILPKHLACLRHYGNRGDFEREENS